VYNIAFSSDPEINRIANEQLSYFVNKFKQSQNEYVLKAKGEAIVKKALKEWTPAKGNLKTFLTAQLQQLSREVYKNQPVYIPENQQLQLYKAKKIITEFEDLHGRPPTAEELAKEMNITLKNAKNLLFLASGAYSTAADFYGEGTIQTHTLRPEDIIESIPDPLHRDIAKDLYLKELPKEKIQNKYGMKQTKFYEIKKAIDNHINQYAEQMYMEE